MTLDREDIKTIEAIVDAAFKKIYAKPEPQTIAPKGSFIDRMNKTIASFDRPRGKS